MKKFSILVPVVAAALFMGCHDYLHMAPPGTTASSKLAICHEKGKGKYNLITVSAAAAVSHVDHGDFLAPVGAKKDKDCVPPVVVPPVVVPPIVVPPIVIDTVVVVPPIVVPPIVIDTIVVVPPPPPPVEDEDGTKEIDDEDRDDIPCLDDQWSEGCVF